MTMREGAAGAAEIADGADKDDKDIVQRVVDGVVIYRAKLRGTAEPVNVSDELTGR